MEFITEPFVSTEVPLDAGSRVLIVDKERIILELLETVLERAGRRVDLALSYQQALALASGEPAIDVALVEHTLLDGSGLELTRRLKELDSNTEVLLMSAAPSMEAVIEALEAGATDLLGKPFDDINQVAIRVTAAEDRATLRRDGKWLHHQLVESEERYRKLFDATPDAVLIIDIGTNRITDANPAAFALYRYSRDELIGLPANKLRMPPNRSGPRSSAPPEGQLPGVFRRNDITRNGVGLEVEFVVGQFHSGGRDVRVEIIREIGERLRAQEAQRKLEAQLLQAQKMEAVGRLAGGIAHDFNNLLAVILNYGDFVVRGLQAERTPAGDMELLDDAQQIIKAATSAASRTRELLAFSRRELVRPDILEVNTLITSLESLLRPALGSKIEFRTQLGRNLGRVRIERGQLESVIVNLAVNARDAMPNGGRLTIATRSTTLEPHDTGGIPAIEVEATDTGTGIEEDILDRIFEPFFTTKDTDKGTGLGLATVKNVVEQAGGRVAVTTKLGQGTSFRLVLPVTNELPEEKSRVTSLSLAPARGATILVVDDDQAVRRSVVRMLESSGFTVISAHSGQEALDLTEQLERPVHLLLTDMLMPGMRGDELAAELRSKRPKLRVIYSTGYAAATLIDEGVLSSRIAVLPKPFTQERLLEAVREALDGT